MHVLPDGVLSQHLCFELESNFYESPGIFTTIKSFPAIFRHSSLDVSSDQLSLSYCDIIRYQLIVFICQ